MISEIFKNFKPSDIIDLLALLALSIGFILSIIWQDRDIALMLGGAIGGVVGVGSRAYNKDKRHEEETKCEK